MITDEKEVLKIFKDQFGDDYDFNAYYFSNVICINSEDLMDIDLEAIEQLKSKIGFKNIKIAFSASWDGESEVDFEIIG